MFSTRYESTEVDCRTWLHVPSGTNWSTSSETHEVHVYVMRLFRSSFTFVTIDILLRELLPFAKLLFSALLSEVFLDIELKFCIWIGFDLNPSNLSFVVLDLLLLQELLSFV